MGEKARWPGSAPNLELPGTDTEEDRQPNLFTDVRGIGFDSGRARIEGVAQTFSTGKALWGAVKQAAWQRVEHLNAARLRAWREKPDAPIPGHPEL